MPALQAFGTKWKIGSDDLVFPFIGSLCNRVFWIAAIGILLVFFADDDACNEVNLLRVYLIVVIVLHGAMIIVELSGCIISSRGTIVNSTPRQHIYIILYVLLACFLVEMVWDVIGFVWAFDPNLQCYDKHILLIFIRCLLLWNSVVSVVTTTYLFIRIGVCKVFCMPKKLKFEDLPPAESFGGRRLSKISSDSLKRHMHRRKWQWRMQTLFCCVQMREFQKSVFSDVSVTLSDAFKQFRGYVPSDIFAGLLLVSMSENNDQQDSSNEEGLPAYCIPKKGCSALKKSFKYFSYASAIYGYSGYVNSNKIIGTLRLLQSCCNKKDTDGTSTTISGDNRCQWNITALLNMTGLRKEDVLYVQFQPEVYLPAFFVAVDHKGKSIVLSIRGTKALHDLLTDLAAQPSVVSSESCEDFYAHTGCLEAAQAILFKLKADGILDAALALYPSYGLVVTGHSLGAGTAVIISILMRTVYGKVHCYAYSPPGGLLSENAALYTRGFITTVIVGDDIVPRLSLQSIEDLGRRILLAIKSCNLPKYKIYLKSMLSWVGWKTKSKTIDFHNSGQDISSVPLMSGSADEESACEFDKVSGKKALPVILDRQDLHLPGRILHIQSDSKTNCGCLSKVSYSAMWMDQGNFTKILVSSKMWAHHRTETIEQALHSLVHPE